MALTLGRALVTQHFGLGCGAIMFLGTLAGILVEGFDTVTFFCMFLIVVSNWYTAPPWPWLERFGLSSLSMMNQAGTGNCKGKLFILAAWFDVDPDSQIRQGKGATNGNPPEIAASVLSCIFDDFRGC
jgi:hypothetical protein